MQGRELSEWIHLTHEREREEYGILTRKLEEAHLRGRKRYLNDNIKTDLKK